MSTPISCPSTLSLAFHYQQCSLDPPEDQGTNSVSKRSPPIFERLLLGGKAHRHSIDIEDWVSETAAASSAPTTREQRHVELNKAYQSLSERFETLARKIADFKDLVHSLDCAARSFQRQLKHEILIAPMKYNCALRRLYYGTLSKRMVELTERLQRIAGQFSVDIGKDAETRLQCPLSTTAYALSTASNGVDSDPFSEPSSRFSDSTTSGHELYPERFDIAAKGSGEPQLGSAEMPHLLFAYALFH